MSVAQDVGGVARTTWREARAHISEYEAQAAELNLDYQTELKNMQAVKERIATTKRETAQIRASRKQLDASWRMEVTKASDVRRQIKAESEDTQRLAHQLTTARNDLAKAKEKEAADRKMHDEHLIKMQAYLQRMEEQVAAAGEQEKWHGC